MSTSHCSSFWPGFARLDALITSLLSVSRIATRTNPTEQVDLNPLLQKLARSVQCQLADKNITLAVESLPVVVGDSARLGQLFSNLIDNAIKYMGDNRERRIHVGVQAGARRASILRAGHGTRHRQRRPGANLSAVSAASER